MDEAQRYLPPVELERRLLAALCADALDRRTRAEVLEHLGAHAFVNPDHEVIFRALSRIPRANLAHIRETLGARLTRLGFPDIDVDPIFELDPPSAKEIGALLRQLKG